MTEYFIRKDSVNYDINSFTFNKELDRSIDTCEVSIVKTSGDNFSIGDEVSIGYVDGAFVTTFAGIISDKTENEDIKITFESYGSIINRTQAEEIYENQSPEYIAEDLITNYTDLTYASTATSGIVIKRLVVNGDSIGSAFKYLLDLLTDWVIKSDNDKNFYFEPKNTTFSTTTVTINKDAYLTSEWNRNPDKIINKLTLVGDVQTFSTDQDSFTAVGGETTLVLSYKPKGNIKITDNGVELVGGVDEGTSSPDYIYNKDTSTVTFAVALTTAHVIGVFYEYEVPVKVTGADDDSIEIYGERATKITDNNIRTMNDARIYVQNYLSNNATEDIGGEFIVAFDRAINVGEQLQVTDTFNNINQFFLVNGTSLEYPNGTKKIKVGKVRFDNLKNQKEINDRLRKLEQQFDNGSLLQLYRQKIENLYTTIDQTYSIKTRDISGTVMVWGSPDFGVWGEKTWGAEPNTAFILGGIYTAILGTSKLGLGGASAYETLYVLNNDNVFTEYFGDSEYINTTSTTATVSDGLVEF